MTTRTLTLTCPACGDASLSCRVTGTRRFTDITLLAQTCDCDPYGGWEDVWEEAREIIYEGGTID